MLADQEGLPQFPYHPVATGSVVAAEVVCACCGQRRPCTYVGPVYAVEELRRRLCPWCIADGRAAAMFDAQFTDAHWRVPRVTATCGWFNLPSELMRKIISTLAVCATLVTVGGCIPSALGRARVTEVAWVSQDKIYFLREIDSEGSELWLRDAGRERKLASNADVLDHCGPLDFLFAVKPGTLGLGMECDGFDRLISYSETTGAFAVLLDVPRAVDVALGDDGRSGYISTGKDDCWEIQPLGDAVRSYLTDWEEYSCRSGKSAKSPAVVGDGSIIFLATNEPRPEQLDGYERRVWRLMAASKERGGVEQVGPELHGLPDLALVPGGSKAVVTVSFNGPAEVLEVDLRSGQSRRIRQTDFALSPSVSPDGKKVAFVDGKGRLVVQKLSS